MAIPGSSEITGMNINAVPLRLPRLFHNIFGSYFPAENLNGGENKPAPHGWLSFSETEPCSQSPAHNVETAVCPWHLPAIRMGI